MQSEYFEKRKAIFIELGFQEHLLPTLEKYIQMLWTSNEELNLISRKMTFEELIDNHVVDCMLALKHFPSSKKTVADFGTGGGLPAIIFAIHFPDTEFLLFEKSKKKQDFLEKCRALVPNLIVAGDIPVELKNVEIVLARAFKPIDVILELSRDYFKKGGKYFLLKGRQEKINEEMVAAKKKFKTLEAKILPLSSPVLEVERHLVLI